MVDDVITKARLENKTIESVIMIIAGDHTLLGCFFNAPNLAVWLY